jgi:ribosomal protein S27AE
MPEDNVPDVNNCPYCGESLFWDEIALKPDADLPPKPWPAGYDAYSDPDYLGAWVCWKCGYTRS